MKDIIIVILTTGLFITTNILSYGAGKEYGMKSKKEKVEESE